MTGIKSAASRPQPAKLRGPTCCPGCGAIHRGGRWRWEEVPAAPRATLCPACRQVRVSWFSAR